LSNIFLNNKNKEFGIRILSRGNFRREREIMLTLSCEHCGYDTYERILVGRAIICPHCGKITNEVNKVIVVEKEKEEKQVE
jgi:uncharacterized Zn finger protein (UPF0148 family)